MSRIELIRSCGTEEHYRNYWILLKHCVGSQLSNCHFTGFRNARVFQLLLLSTANCAINGHCLQNFGHSWHAPYVSRVLMVLLIWIACVQQCVPNLLLNQTPATAVPSTAAAQDCLGTQFALLVESATQLAVSTDFLGLLFAVVGRFCARFWFVTVMLSRQVSNVDTEDLIWCMDRFVLRRADIRIWIG